MNIESEKKWLVDHIPVDIKLELLPKQEIVQYYIKHPKFGASRMRSIDNNNFLITKKYNNKHILGKVEIEEPISEKEFEMNKEHIIKPNHGEIKKTRYSLTLEGDLHAELDVFHGSYEGIIFLEIEFDDIHNYSHFKRPERVGKNISGIITNKALFLKWPSLLKKFIKPVETHPIEKKVKKINRATRRKLLKLNKHLQK